MGITGGFIPIAIVFCFRFVSLHSLPVCTNDVVSYALTQCDDQGGRWRVAVPYNESFKCVPPSRPALRIQTCETSCPAGYFYSLEALNCTECPAGTFSTGNAQIYEEWSVLPIAFHVQTTPIGRLTRLLESTTSDPVTCSKQTWTPRGDYVSVEEGEGCLSKLFLDIDLVQEGHVEFEYSFPESSLMFVFSVVKAECDLDGQRDPKNIRTALDQTYKNFWATSKVPLPKGKQRLVWTVMGLTSGSQEFAHRSIRVRKVAVAGMKYSPVCTPCPAGTSSSRASSKCMECPKNFWSSKGMPECVPCPPHQYALPGYPKCFDRSQCTSSDYHQTISECGSDEKAEISYAWIEPKICQDDPNVQLPAPSRNPCPRCPLGMVRYNASFCGVCDGNQYATKDGNCQACPVQGLVPAYEYRSSEWNYMPYGMTSLCWSPSSMGCANDAGWQLQNDSIISGYGHEDDSLLALQLVTSGFRSVDASGRYGKVTFDFEMRCGSPKCELDLILEDTENVDRIQSWTGPQPRKTFDFYITRNASLAVSWIFVKDVLLSSALAPITKRRFDKDSVRLFSVSMTNTLDGGASSCEACTGAGNANCIRCARNERWNARAQHCEPCPKNSIISEQSGQCTPCGENLVASKHTCISNCEVTLTHLNHMKQYDLKGLKGYHQATTRRFFQDSGENYYHEFNISFCEEAPAVCNNVMRRTSTSSRIRASGSVCRSTQVYSDSSSNTTTAVHSFVTGQDLSTITASTRSGPLEVGDKFHDVLADFPQDQAPDFYYYFQSPGNTASCPSGKNTILTMRCSKNVTDDHDIRVPTECPDGTCDGCTYRLLWRTPYACPVCGPDDYAIVRGECSGGHQNIYYHSKEYCHEVNASSALVKRVECTAVPFAVKVTIIVLVCSGAVLAILVYVLYKSVKKYEYKYMKLVHDATGVVHLQLPESCVDEHDMDGNTDEGENDDADNQDNGYDIGFRTPSETVYTKVKKAITKKKDVRRPTRHLGSLHEENQLLTD